MISGLCRTAVLAQQVLALVLLAQILLSVQLAHQPNLSSQWESQDAASRLVGLAANVTATQWGHDLLKAIGDPPVRWSAAVVASAWLVALAFGSLLLAWLGLRAEGGGLGTLRRPARRGGLRG